MNFKIKKDMRPKEYLYWKQLMTHLKNDTTVFFNGELIFPRQLEIHLPGNHKYPCLLRCYHCAGQYFIKELGNWELDALEILNQLKGAVPYHIYGGAYTEPLLNPYFMTFLATTKRYKNHFGIHTNGVLLEDLEKNYGFLTELNRISTDRVDYLSISLDAGTPASWAKIKRGKPEWFDKIIMGIERAVKIRKKNKKGHAIRICYLISDYNSSIQNIKQIVNIAKTLKVDSLRFSIPFGAYNQQFEVIKEYKREKEIPLNQQFEILLAPFLSNSKKEKPYIFYTGPEFTDIDLFNFRHCVYCYYQITFGADGYYYRCSTTATPTMKMCRLGKIDNSLDNFKKMILRNMNANWDAMRCFEKGARCNRMGLEINLAYQKLKQC